MDFLKRFGPPFAGFLFLSLLVFGASMQYGFSVIDDQFLIVNNLHIRGITLENLQHIFTTFDPELYIPFTLLSFQLNYLLGDLNAVIYHFTNILLHAGSATVLFWILQKCTDKKWVQIFGALLFLLHPINTEAVVWVAGRKDVLSTFFALLSVTFFISSSREASHSDRNENEHNEMRASCLARAFHPYFLSILFFLFALLSKASVITLPVVLLLLEVFRRSDEPILQSSRKALRSLLPFFGLSVLFGIIALLGKERVVGDTTLFETILVAAKSTMFYLQNLVWPVGLNPVYPYTDKITLTSIDFWLPLGLIIVITVVLIWYLRRSRWPLFAWLSYIILLSPTFLNIEKGGITYFAVDRYAYLSLIPIFILIALWFGHMHEKLWRKRALVMGASGVIVIILSALAFIQVATWQSDEVLLKRSIQLYPDNVLARTSLASLYRAVGDLESEDAVLREGQQINNHIAYVLGRGSVLERSGNLEGALEMYEQAEIMEPKNPEPAFYQGVIAERRGDEERAIGLYEKAANLDDSYVSPMINLGAIYSDRGEPEIAEDWYRKALKWSTGSFELQYNMGLVLEEQKKTDEALEYFENAYELHPTDPDVTTTYAYRLYERGDLTQSLEVVERYLQESPENRTVLRLRDLILETGQ